MKNNNKFKIGLAAFLMLTVIPALSFGAVSYFMDCAWEGTEFVCEIYADTDGDAIISGGVKLSYDTNKLSSPTAEKNEAVWFFGTNDQKFTYMDPEIDTGAGTIVYIVGKLDEDEPTAGVTGGRVLIGKATFVRSDADDPCSENDPVGFYDLGLMLGRDGNYENFVSTAGDLLDDSAVMGPIEAAERGDANADCDITTADYISVRNLIGSENPPPYADCNGDGSVSTGDYICVRNKI
jgi:hypothetical protein